ncbi:MAG: WecB/TagA/CpsF family glycosyltransferase, partial [Phycisphaerae bacterium]|nr:WecB/TagA/CpsF family glycosyltransferase [Phycisphaerae bacterium]
MGVPLSRVTMAQAVDHIARAARAGQGGWLMTPNLDILRRLVKDPSFASLTRAADVRLADGMPLIWASRLRGDPLPERVAGSDLIWHLTARAAT